MTEVSNRIIEIIKSENFKSKLEIINENYPNLKQEQFIRNAILEIFNSDRKEELKAFAEHRIKGTRIDLSVVNYQHKEKAFKIELKYQFSKDSKNMTKYVGTIEKDFVKRESDMFILIIAHWERKEKDEHNKWGIGSNLNKFLSSTNEWKQNIDVEFMKIKDSELEKHKIDIVRQYSMEYYFYILKKIN